MASARDQANVPRDFGDIQIIDALMNPKIVDEIWIRDTLNVPRRAYKRGMRLVATPPGVTGFGITPTITSGSTTVDIVGGSPPYSHSWAIIASDGGAFSVLSPTSQSTAFRGTGVTSGASATARDTVNDANGLTAFIDVTVNLENVRNSRS